jgi:hypothetical protein
MTVLELLISHSEELTDVDLLLDQQRVSEKSTVIPKKEIMCKCRSSLSRNLEILFEL